MPDLNEIDPERLRAYALELQPYGQAWGSTWGTVYPSLQKIEAFILPPNEEVEDDKEYVFVVEADSDHGNSIKTISSVKIDDDNKPHHLNRLTLAFRRPNDPLPPALAFLVDNPAMAVLFDRRQDYSGPSIEPPEDDGRLRFIHDTVSKYLEELLERPKKPSDTLNQFQGLYDPPPEPPLHNAYMGRYYYGTDLPFLPGQLLMPIVAGDLTPYNPDTLAPLLPPETEKYVNGLRSSVKFKREEYGRLKEDLDRVIFGPQLKQDIEQLYKKIEELIQKGWKYYEDSGDRRERENVKMWILGAVYRADEVDALLSPPDSPQAETEPQINNEPPPPPETDTARTEDKPVGERACQRHKSAVRQVAQDLWSRDQTITIADMILRDEINNAYKRENGELYTEKTLRNWINDLCPDRSAGRRPNKSK